MNARQKRMFEDAQKRNPNLKMPVAPKPLELTEEDLARVKQGVGDKTGRPPLIGEGGASAQSDEPAGDQAGFIVTYFGEKGFGFLRPDDGGRDIFFHVSRLVESDPTLLNPGTRVLYQLGMDRTGKIAARSVKVVVEEKK